MNTVTLMSLILHLVRIFDFYSYYYSVDYYYKNIRVLWLLLLSGLLLYLIYHLLLSDSYYFNYNYIKTSTTTINTTGTADSTVSYTMIVMNMKTLYNSSIATNQSIHNINKKKKKKMKQPLMNYINKNMMMFEHYRNKSIRNINNGVFISNKISYHDNHHDHHNGDNDASNDTNSHFDFAVCILSRDISLINLSWLYDLIEYNISPYVVLDSIDNNTINSSYSKYATVISINSMDSKAAGYFWGGSKHIYDRSNKNQGDFYRKFINAWDKSLLYFIEIATQHSFVWFIEYDVYIPSMPAFLRVHKDSVVSHKADLVIRESIELSNARVHKFNDFLKAPFYSSLACTVGASRKLLNIIKQYVAQYHQLEYIEILFTTLSRQHHLKIYHPLQFQAIQFRCNFTCGDIYRYPDQWFHPIKDQLHFVNDCSNRIQNLRSNESINKTVMMSIERTVINSYNSNYDDDVDSYSTNRSVFRANSSSRYEYLFTSDNNTRIRFENEANCTLSK